MLFFSDPVPDIFSRGVPYSSEEEQDGLRRIDLPKGLQDRLTTPLTVVYQSALCDNEPLGLAGAVNQSPAAVCPIPEPSSLALFTSGVLGFLAYRMQALLKTRAHSKIDPSGQAASAP